MIKLNGGIGKPYVDAIKPRMRSFFTPTYLYAADGTEKPLKCNTGYHIQISSPSDGDYFIIPVFCSGSETILELSHYKGTDKGIVDLYVNGVLDSSAYDQYASSSTPSHTSITLTRPIVAGWNEIKFVVNGKNASSSSYYLGIYGVRLR